MTFSIGLYAPGISSTTPESLRHSTPRVWSSRSRVENRFFAAFRLIRRPAPCEAELNDVGVAEALHDVRTGAHRARDDADSPAPARIAPLRVTSRSMPSYRSSAT